MLNLVRLIACLLLLTAGAASTPAQAKTASGPYQEKFTVSVQLERDNWLFLLGKTASNRTSASEKLFTGEQYDQGLDQYYLRARYYDPNIGRFTQQDSWMGSNQDPVTLHKYLYANVDPVMMVDPSGRFSDIGSLMTGIGVLAIITTGAQYNSYLNSSSLGSPIPGHFGSSEEEELIRLTLLATMVGANSSLFDLYKVKESTKEKLREHVARPAYIGEDGFVHVVNEPLTMSEAVLLVRAGSGGDVMANNQAIAHKIALIAGGGAHPPVGPEVSVPNPNKKYPTNPKRGFLPHYHTWDRNGAHVFF